MKSLQSLQSGLFADFLRAFAAISCLGGFACHGNDVTWIEVARRHIVQYGHAPFALAVRVIDRAGIVVSPLDVTVHVSSNSVVHLIPPNEFVWDHAGTANLEVQAGRRRRGWTSSVDRTQ